MKIAVCAKVVPSTAAPLKPKADGSGMDTAGIKWEISPYDSFALEAAVQIVEKQGGSVHLFSVGDDNAVGILRNNGLTVGAADLTIVDDAAVAAGDPLIIARALAAAIQAAGCEAVFCGKQAADDDNVQVPAMIAELLGWPQVSVVTKLEATAAAFTATREVGGGVQEIVTGSFPAVLTTDKGINTPRLAKLPDIAKAKTKPVHKKTAADLGLSGDALRSHVVVASYGAPPPRPASKLIPGDAAAAAAELVRLLKNEAKVL